MKQLKRTSTRYLCLLCVLAIIAACSKPAPEAPVSEEEQLPSSQSAAASPSTSAPLASTHPSETRRAPIAAPEGIKGGLAALRESFQSFVLNTKRTLTVTTEDIGRKRSDEITLTQDAQGNFHFLKDGNFKKSAMDFYWVDGRVYRKDLNRWFAYGEAQTIFKPLVENSVTFWEDFLSEFGDKMKLQKKGSAEWHGRKCTRYELSSLQENSDSDGVRLSGDLLVDDEKGVILRSSLKAIFPGPLPEHTQERLATLKKPTPAPTNEEITQEENQVPEPDPETPHEMSLEVVLHEQVDKIDQVEKVVVPPPSEESLQAKTSKKK